MTICHFSCFFLFFLCSLEEDTNSKHEEGDEGDDDLTGSKDEQQRAPSATDSKDTDLDRPSSSGTFLILTSR